MGAYLHIGFVAKATTELPADISKGKLLNVIEDDYPDNMPDDFQIDGKRIRLYTTIVVLGSEGKFLMEECEKTLQFMETCAHRAYAGFQLGKAFRVFVF